jgi:hypothetical protein
VVFFSHHLYFSLPAIKEVSFPLPDTAQYISKGLIFTRKSLQVDMLVRQTEA